ncbi:DHH family phosphoesterase [Corynebacterium liangguodongii]|uniref:Exopolyphosphatase n=1 Tax=Corynebacterium liangguodongii TaxID=2079535 RepID=A0A2S0WEY5_9CORY|nr:bifunctional oligoribonuclease/PAP phosphatase NrnA [Corynebacterium liangguodongii]AWB84222.1 exopolyphosphatase [Corynebacterium liangguodongii]PWC00232.1 bifunctional oligoribonuclease/PAP phosphatase NrnA [Corynebacterium liangguodongii]
MNTLFPAHTAQFAEVAATIAQARSVAVIAHVSPDADAVGSACALVAGIMKAGGTARAYIGQAHPHAENLSTVPFVDDIVYGHEPPTEELWVTVDCASADRTGAHAPAIAAAPERVVVVDHHASNPGFGATNLIVASESTTAMVRELLAHLQVDLDETIAHCLYAGLVTDTGNFRWGTPRMHVLAAELMACGLDTRQIAMDLMDAITLADMRNTGVVLAGMEERRAAGLDLAVFTIDTELMAQMSQTAIEGVIEYARSALGSDVGVVLKQRGAAEWSVSLRSATVDVAAVASRLGGGGHVPAAGFTGFGSREEVITGILAALS